MSGRISSLVVASAGVLALVTAAPAHGAQAVASPSDVSAPPCVQWSAGWRYTLVTNGCDTAQRITVTYTSGADIPCRTAGPGDTVTFPGYGTQGDSVLGVVLCPTSPR